jgi:hypothetical protein
MAKKLSVKKTSVKTGGSAAKAAPRKRKRNRAIARPAKKR